ncbi:MAG: recombinase family protein, partial [bacterium]|nr:recombinase family protein [bacterium]
LIYDPDRLARRYSYQELVMDELREAGIEVLFVTTSTPKNEEDKILYGVKGLFAQYERAKISERFRLGKLRKVREGHLLVSEALYGYTYIRGDKEKKIHGYYEINPAEARVVKMIFGWIAGEGLTFRKVVKRLQELGIKPRKSKRGVWNTSTLTTMLRNRAYIGEARWGSSYAVVPENPTNREKYRKMKKSSRRIKPEEEWIASKIPVPVIVDRDLFTRARTQLKTNFDLCQRNKKNEYLLAGKIWCSCGERRAGEGPQHGKYLYYRCTNRTHSFPLPPTCVEKGINARIADKLVWQKISKLMSSPELLFKQIRRWSDERRSQTSGSTADVDSIKKEIVRLRKEEDRYAKAYGAGLFSIERLKEYTNPLRERASSLEEQIIKAQVERGQINEATLPGQGEVESFAEKAVKALQNLNFEARKVIIRNTVDKIMGSPNGLQVYGYIPIENINHVEYKTIHRHCRPAQRGQIHPFPDLDPETGGPFQLSFCHHRSQCRRRWRARRKGG